MQNDFDGLVFFYYFSRDFFLIFFTRRAYNALCSALEADPSLADKLCLNGPYDTGMWRLTSQPQPIPGVRQQVMDAFIIVSVAMHSNTYAYQCINTSIHQYYAQQILLKI